MNPFTWLRQWYRIFKYTRLDRHTHISPNAEYVGTQTREQYRASYLQPTPNYWNTIPDQQEVMQRHNVDENGMLRQPTPEPDSVCRLWDNNGIWEITLSSTRLKDEEGSDWLGNFTMSQSDFKRLCNHKNQEAIQKFLAGLDKVDTTNHKRVDRNTWMEGVRHD